MNKQELIEAIKFAVDPTPLDLRDKSYNAGLLRALTLAEQLDEPPVLKLAGVNSDGEVDYGNILNAPNSIDASSVESMVGVLLRGGRLVITTGPVVIGKKLQDPPPLPEDTTP